eukprot:TRINITY_DN1681_c1_g1_i1.p1 TRINITY_DN1681_c1_g1~~TRINITY_DN1681_c1_g1_i1.p1  ORF type:complete len:435 (+),score=88.41 TRINITY_DN1681_c1_g1_i1:51-1307(+)
MSAGNFGKQSIDDLNVKGKRVLMRVDFNVPVKDGLVKNDLRIRGAIPTIKKVIEEGGSVILMSHLGRPKGIGYEAQYSLRPVADRLSQLLSQDVLFAEDCMNAHGHCSALKPCDVILLENLRFHKAESSKDKELREGMARVLASYGDLFVSDAFGTAHRNAASMTGIPKLLGQGACGYLMKKEIDYFSSALSNPPRPMCAIIGGAKVSDKILLLDNLIETCDKLIIGGAMAYTFLKAKNIPVGKSKCETVSKDKKGNEVNIVKLADKLLKKAEKKGVQIVLPVDHRCAAKFEDVDPIITSGPEIPANLMALDVGPKTEHLMVDVISACKTAIWNGPVGVFEFTHFRSGTWAIARTMAKTPGMLSIVGGGDSAAAAEKSGYGGELSHISTGGGASLELMEGKTLPGLKALTPKPIASKL